MKYLSVCSGIEAATVAWHSLGWQPVGFSEIEPFPSAVLAHHYPSVPNLGDMTKYKEWNIEQPNILVGGTPCQSFSVAGLRKGLDDPRGNLALTYCGILDHFKPQWFVWENVPGVLSSNGGRDFGSFLGALAELGYGFAYRVLDAQFFGVAQRRRRVFVVGYLGDWRPSAAVLFERESLLRDTAPSREKRENTSTSIGGGVELSGPLSARDYKDPGTDGLNKNSAKMVPVCFEPRSPDGHARVVGNFSPTLNRMGGGQREPCVMYPDWPAEVAPTLNAHFGEKQGLENQHIGGGQDSLSLAKCLITKTRLDAETETLIPTIGGGFDVAQPIPFDTTQITSPQNGSNPQPGAPCHPLAAGAHIPAIASLMAVRRLTPVECERLQGFPDNYTNIPWRKKEESPDGPRYKALGNSMAVPVMNWIGKKIKKVCENY